MNIQKPGKSESHQISVRDVAGILFRHKTLICVTFLTVALGTAAVTFLMPNEYESRMKILVKNTRSDVPITPGATMGTTGNYLENEVSENQINSEVALLTSGDLINQVVTEVGLYHRKPGLSARLGLKEAVGSQAGQVEQASAQLAKDLSITPVKKANIIEVKYTSGSPETAVAVLRKLQDLYLEKHLKLHRPPGTYEFFKGQADNNEAQLREAERQLSGFQQSMNVVSLTQQKEQTVQKHTEAKSKLLETNAFLREVNERIAKVQQQLETIQPRIVTQRRALPNQYSVERLNTMIVELQNRRTQLLTKFRPEDRLVREVDQQIKTTRAALEKATGETITEQSTDLNPLRQTLETERARARVDQAGAQGRQEMLASQVSQYESQLSRLEGITAQYEDLNRKVKQSADNFQLYKQKEEEARITDELDQNKITNVSIAEAPAQPQMPVSPNRPLNLIMGLFLGALLAAGSVVIAEFMRDTVLTPRELEALTSAKVLASVPRVSRMRAMLDVQARRSTSHFAESSKPKKVRAVISEARVLSQPGTTEPRLSPPKLVREPHLDWASGE
ncbi:MAG TPA: Wzz/FepE/Etk N-terminal domain-containing protein [Pyrinomonadaceae bacterium]|nr:Wzz/FepE/Etk N-terminal domain-containing protein [Pyrinomonadaceae bacterium]